MYVCMRAVERKCSRGKGGQCNVPCIIIALQDSTINHCTGEGAPRVSITGAMPATKEGSGCTQIQV